MSLSGILKRKKPNQPNEDENERFNELFIFGYSCRLFRDDAKALEIENSLIPLNGNENLKIDRFDVRATLTDKELSALEAPQAGWWSSSNTRNLYLSKDEQIAEQLAEEERYYSLFHNEIEEKMYEEEEQKRMQDSYGQFQFDYSNPKKNEFESNEQDESSQDSDEVYIMPLNLNAPIDMALPVTMKQHAIIEKTAKFISKQGQQMEILIKAKQSNNTQFEFLNYNNRLNPYYKFILEAFKSDTYPKSPEPALTDNILQDISKLNQNNFNEQNDIKVLPTLKYVPSADCSYTQLISKIKGVPIPFVPHIMNQEKKDNLSLNKTNKNLPHSSECHADVKKISSGLALALAYGSNSESEEEVEENGKYANCSNQANLTKKTNFSIPPESLQNIIDKTAAYVKKNGKQFEETLKRKGDERFLFLNEGNEYYPYYSYMVLGTPSTPIQELSNKNSYSKILTSVSFSIKQKDESSITTKTQMKPALQLSDDETNALANNNNKKPNLPEKVIKAIKMVENQLVSKSVMINNHSIESSKLSSGRIINNIAEESNKLEIQKEVRRAEEKVKDRLAQIAREKLGLISKEKQLQLERKKKAVAFLSQIKVNEPSVSDNIKSDKNNASDNESVHSIPLSSHGEKEENKLINTNSRSRSPNKNNHKSKKSKHSKKKSKRRSNEKSRSKSPSEVRQNKSLKKSKKRKHDRDV